MRVGPTLEVAVLEVQGLAIGFRREGARRQGRNLIVIMHCGELKEVDILRQNFNQSVVALSEPVNTNVEDEVSSKTAFRRAKPPRHWLRNLHPTGPKQWDSAVCRRKSPWDATNFKRPTQPRVGRYYCIIDSAPSANSMRGRSQEVVVSFKA